MVIEIRAWAPEGSIMRMTVTRAACLSLIALGVGVSIVACGQSADPGAVSATTAVNSTPATTTQPTTTSPSTVSGAIVVNESIEHGPQQKPSELDFYEHTQMTGIVWSSWGGATAQ